MGEITDKTEALSVVKADSWELENVSDELKADKEVVMAAVKNNGDVFDAEATKLKDVHFLAQGTIYPDVIESSGSNQKRPE